LFGADPGGRKGKGQAEERQGERAGKRKAEKRHAQKREATRGYLAESRALAGACLLPLLVLVLVLCRWI